MYDKPVQEQQENTPVVRKSAGEKAIKSCPAYENTTSFTATGMSVLYLTLIRCHTFLTSFFIIKVVISHHQGESEEKKNDEYENA